jgi:hypothetical protein
VAKMGKHEMVTELGGLICWKIATCKAMMEVEDSTEVGR